MISVMTLARLTVNPADLCPDTWEIEEGKPCPATRCYSHECVGDVNHLGKHVCRCGALQRVGL